MDLPLDLARAILLADDASPPPKVAADSLRALRRALAAEKGATVTELVRLAALQLQEATAT